MWPKGVSYASLACVSPIWVVCGTHTDAHMHPRMHACLFTPEGLSLNSMLSEGHEDHIFLFSHSRELGETSKFSADPAFTSSGGGAMFWVQMLGHEYLVSSSSALILNVGVVEPRVIAP